MPGGALCHIATSRRTSYGYDERIEVFGSGGLVQSRLKPTREVSLYTGSTVISEGVHPAWLDRLAPSFALALDACICTVEGRKVASPSLMEGARPDHCGGCTRIVARKSTSQDYLLAARMIAA